MNVRLLTFIVIWNIFHTLEKLLINVLGNVNALWRILHSIINACPFLLHCN